MRNSIDSYYKNMTLDIARSFTEFIDADYSERVRLVNELSDKYEKAYTNKTVDPWLRYSAAVGMAENSSDDNTAEFVFKCADKAMYNAKKAFKEKYGSSR